MIKENVCEIIGNTPIVKLNNLKKKLNLKGNIYAKLEYFEPAGSIKDRVAYNMLVEAKKSGKIKDGGTIVEPTSGNTGIGLACLCASLGYKAIFTMPNTMSVERIKLLKAYGSEVVLTDGKLGMKGAIDCAKEIVKNTPNSFMPSQFDNEDNPNAHYKTTAPEIWNDFGKDLHCFVATIGTGGTITGNARYLKEKNPNIYVVGVEPANSPLITKGYSGSHNIQGIGANFIPKILDLSLINEVVAVDDQDAYEYSRMVAKYEGILVGISSGAALLGAINIAKREEMEDKNILVIFPDGGDKYLSTQLFE